MKRTYATSMVLLASTLTPSLLVTSTPALARDDLPESLRLEQQAQKDYSQKPVVPIDRGNAHHRNLGGSTDDEGLPPAVTPGAVTPDDAWPSKSPGNDATR